MRRIDIIGIGVGLLVVGGVLYLILQKTGLDSIHAGIWSQVLLVGGLIIWVLTYLLRVVTHKMTYNQQIEDYKQAVLQKRLEEMTPEEIAQLQAEIAQEKQNQPKSDYD